MLSIDPGADSTWGNVSVQEQPPPSSLEPEIASSVFVVLLLLWGQLRSGFPGHDLFLFLFQRKKSGNARRLWMG